MSYPESDSNSKTAAAERRGNPRRQTMTVFTLRVGDNSVLGAGRDVSERGAYFVTSDNLNVDVCFDVDGRETHVQAKVVRMDPISPGTVGVALEFDRKLREDELP